VVIHIGTSYVKVFFSWKSSERCVWQQEDFLQGAPHVFQRVRKVLRFLDPGGEERWRQVFFSQSVGLSLRRVPVFKVDSTPIGSVLCTSLLLSRIDETPLLYSPFLPDEAEPSPHPVRMREENPPVRDPVRSSFLPRSLSVSLVSFRTMGTRHLDLR